MKIKVTSFNIHLGRKIFPPGLSNLIPLTEFIRREKPDLVAIQEMPLNNTQTLRFYERLEPEYSWVEFPLFRHKKFIQGNVIFSKYPLVDCGLHDISFSDYQTRGMLLGHIRIDSQAIFFGNLHLGLASKERAYQLLKLEEVLRANTHPSTPLILAGDFNDWRKSFPISETLSEKMTEVFCARRGRLARTYPSWLPTFCLDRIYVRHFEVLSTRVHRTPAVRALSDHLAITTELETATLDRVYTE